MVGTKHGSLVAALVAMTLAAGGQGRAQVGGSSRALFRDFAGGEVTSVSLESGEGIPSGPLGRFGVVPLRLTARDGVDRFRRDLPQTEASRGEEWIRLADGGSLVHFRLGARAKSGILHVDANGRSTVLLEQALVAGRSALTQFAGVSAWAPFAAIVTHEDRVGRGDVYLLRLDGKTFASSGTPALLVTGSIGLAEVDPFSLTFSRSALWFVHGDRELYRVSLADETGAQRVDLPDSGGKAPAELAEELAVSADGSTLVLLAGQNEGSWDLYVAADDGTARNLTQKPSAYQEVGHTTSIPNGPHLALAPDGSSVTFGDENPDLELFHCGTDGKDPLVHLTPDQWFEHSLDEGSSIITALASVVLTFGELGTAQDVYRIDLGAGVVQSVDNLTLTSGDGDGAPWETGAQLTPCLVGRADGGDAVWLLDERTVSGQPRFDLWTTDGARSRLQRADLTAIPRFAAFSNGRGSVDFHSAVCWDDGTSQSIGLLPSRADAPLDVVLTAPSGVALRGLTVRGDGLDLAFVASAGSGFEVVAAIDLRTRNPRLLTPRFGWCGEGVRYSSDGRLLLSHGLTPVRFALMERRAGSSRTQLLDVPPGDLEVLR